ncbi:MAG: putative porin [Candidatus Omnitrophica bacterium]|nr:putative porin [Candidatus Omnitrophota bacterium]
MLRKLGTIMIVGLAVLSISAGGAVAGEMDLLVQKLVEKGVLSAGEAQELVTETHEQIKKQNAMGTNDLLPQWVQTMKIKGDTRVRFEAIKDKSALYGASKVYPYDPLAGASTNNTKYLTHERLRVRLGLEANPNDQMKVGIGIATGKGSDPRSRNVSLGNDNTSTGTDYDSASPKNIVLDYAYAQYTPLQYATITAGKFQNPIWSPWDMVWKGDITPEGMAVQLNYPINSDLKLFVNNLDFVLRDADALGAKQPGLYAVQPGVSWNITPNTNLKSAVAYYQFENLRGNPRISYGVGGNRVYTTSGVYDPIYATTSVYGNNYNSIQPNAELGFKEPFGGLVHYASIFGDYIKNLSAHHLTSVSGYDVGVKFGVEKVSDWKEWEMKLATSKMGKDAFVDAFTDSDRYQKGMTGTQSYEGIFEFGLGKNSSLVLDYYYSFLIDKTNLVSTGPTTYGSGHRPEQLLQIDWNLKF